MDDERLGADKADRVANHVYAAIGEAADGLYVLAPGADPTRIRPLRLDVGAIDRYTATIVPRSLRDAVVEITAAALDPDDSFGNDVVRLVTVGSLLHGLVTRRDLPAKPDLTGFRILLDTSVLIDLVVGTGAERQVMRDLVRCSQQLGVEVIVAEHTLEEWGRVWDAAETEATATLPEEISENTHRLASNPFAQAWLRALCDDRHLAFPRFRARTSDIRRHLAEMQVTVRPHGNNTDQDRSLADDVRDRLLEPRPNGRPPRTRNAATADGHTAAMVARWRARPATGPNGAYQIAHGIHTNRAYEDARPDDNVPLVVTPTGWMVFVAAMTTDDPAQRTGIATMLSDAAVRTAFFGMATGYTVEDAVALSAHFAEAGNPLSAEDTRIAIQADLLNLIEAADSEASAQRRSAAVVQHRNNRREARLSRQQTELERTRAEREALVANAETTADVYRSEWDTEKKSHAETQETLAGREADVQRLQRILYGGAVWTAAAVVVLVLALTDVLGGWVLAVATGLTLLLLVKVKEYVADPAKTLCSLFWWAAAELVGVLVVNVAAGKL